MRLFLLSCILVLVVRPICTAQSPIKAKIRVGAEQMEQYLPLMAGKQIGLVVNHSSLVGSRHLVDTLTEKGVCILRIFAPEHGFRGAAPDGEHLKDGIDRNSGVPIVSLYGKKRYPAAADLAGIDLLVFDIQDVGTRFYTYISTLFNVLDACGKYSIPVLILDRPNPNGHYVDGPVLDMRLQSFVGMAPLPVVHGCTVGELAQLFTGEYWTGALPPPLTVIKCQNYTHQTSYQLPVPPSPNLPNQLAVLLYPSLCFFEGTAISIGRGTDWPFQIIGHPQLPDSAAISFTPKPNAGSKYPPQKGKKCWGQDFRSLSMDSLFQQKRIDLGPLLQTYHAFPDKKTFFLKSRYFNKLAGTFSLWSQIEEGENASDIRASWQEDLNCFKAIRSKYLLYPE